MKRLFCLALILAFMVSLTPQTVAETGVLDTDWYDTDFQNMPSRIADKSAIDTAIEISKQTGWSGTAVLASSESYGMADALAVGPLAFSLQAPILLTENRAVLNAGTKAELLRLEADTVYITSGTAVIPQSVRNEITAMGITVIPLGGSNRSETSVNIAKRMTDVIGVAVANSIPDALSIAPIAAAANQPILLVDKDNVSSSITDYLLEADILYADVIGGTGVISDDTAAKFPDAQRYFGNTAYDTNYQVIQYFAGQLNFDLVYVANGETAIDALAGVPLVAMTESPIVLTNNRTVPMVALFIFDQFGESSQLTALGGTAVVSESIYARIKQGDVGNLDDDWDDDWDEWDGDTSELKVTNIE